MRMAVLLLPLLLLVACARPGGEWPLGSPERSDRPLTLRIHVSGTFASTAGGTHARIREIVRDADRIFWSDVGAHLVVDEIVDGWKVDVSSSEGALNDLHATDPGDGVDVVVGMLGGESHANDWTGGRAMLGKSVMVVRSEDADEEWQRQATVVVFLHELGHALGAPHDDAPGDIMNAHAGADARTYGESSSQIVQRGLALHGIEAEYRVHHASRTSTASATAPSTDASSSALNGVDRSTLEQANDAEHAGNPDAAWRLAEPLFSRYPDVVAVQDLRCRLAQARGLAWPDVRAECASLMKLMMAGASGGSVE
jgi:hypothetical protein